jgi:hypothetical protein
MNQGTFARRDVLKLMAAAEVIGLPRRALVLARRRSCGRRARL